VLIIVHQFFPQFFGGTETIAERTARVLAADGYAVDIITSVMAEKRYLPSLLESPLCPPEARVLLAEEPVPLGRPIRFRYCEGVEVHAFTNSHDPAYRRPTFQQEVTSPAIEAELARLLGGPRPERAIVFHQLHFPMAAIDLLRPAGVPVTFVATDFFAVCPLGNLQYEDGRDCTGPGPGAVRCVRHLSDRRGWVKWLQDGLPAPLLAFYLDIYRRLGPWPTYPVHPHQNLYYLLERAHRSRRFLRTADRVIAPSSRIERSLRAAGVPPGRLVRLPYGMPPPVLGPRRGRLRDAEFRLAFAGAIGERKGLHVLLDALERLPPATGPWTLDIWGDFARGAEYAEAQAARLPAFGGRVRQRGTFESYRIHEVMDAYDMIVIPSTWAENLPLVLLSALQIGLPVVISDAQGLLDAFPDGTVHGRSFRMNDADDLARVLGEEIAARKAYDPAAAPRIPSVEEFAAVLMGRPREGCRG
jgi:glycosyltransferase involved in cell wall biosynthesis